MKKKILILPVIFLFFILIIFFYLLIIDRNPSKLPSALINKKVPIFEAESLMSDKAFISSDEFKDHIILLNFFATWCKPCKEEHKFIKKFSKNKKIKVIGVNYKDNPKKTIVWLKEMGNPYSDIIIDKDGKIAIDWGVYGIPETFIINSQMTIKHRHVGAITNKVYNSLNLIIKDTE